MFSISIFSYRSINSLIIYTFYKNIYFWYLRAKIDRVFYTIFFYLKKRDLTVRHHLALPYIMRRNVNVENLHLQILANWKRQTFYIYFSVWRTTTMTKVTCLLKYIHSMENSTGHFSLFCTFGMDYVWVVRRCIPAGVPVVPHLARINFFFE